ncbi:MAG: hypothetical protein LC624_07980 [Halobacteriales archaeon]|nr:hypothetical protein [Halobacteriales archaeon]
MDLGLAAPLLGLALFLFPGVAWARVVAPDLGLGGSAGLSVVLAFTLAPAALFALNTVFAVPVRPDVSALLAAGFGMAGLAAGLRPFVSRLGA